MYQILVILCVFLILVAVLTYESNAIQKRDIQRGRADHPYIQAILKEVIATHTLGFYLRDGTLYTIREPTLKGLVLYCVEQRERIPVSNVLRTIHPRPRWWKDVLVVEDTILGVKTTPFHEYVFNHHMWVLV